MKDIGTALEGELLRKGYSVITPVINDYCIAQYSSSILQELHMEELRTLRMVELRNQDPDLLCSQDIEFYARLLHPQIPEYKESFIIDSLHFTAKQHVGSSLADSIAQGKKIIKEEQARRILEEMLIVLDYAHQKGIVHGHVTPKFIFLRERAFLDFYPDLSQGTASDDIYHLGYALLAAAVGQDLQTMPQHFSASKRPKDFFPYSEKLNLLWQKLIQEQRGRRYQSAKQVLDDLQDLSRTDQYILQARIHQEIRSPITSRLLIALEQKDPYFEANVKPQVYRSILDDDEMLSHLRQIYSKNEFEIDDEKTILRTLRIGDTVKKKGNLSTISKQVDNGDEGILFKRQGSMGKVKFATVSAELLLSELEVIAKRDFGTIGISPLSASSFQFEPQIKYVVRYRGNTKYLGEAVLDGTKGLVFSTDPIYIVWERENTTQTITRNLFGGVKSQSYKPKDFVLIRKNEVDFEKLYQECYKGE